MNSGASDFRYALRSLLKSPGYTLTASLILALGLGLSMYMFGAINGYVLKPLPFPDPVELTHVEFNRPEEGTFSLALSVHDLVDFRREQTSPAQPLRSFRDTICGSTVTPSRL